jgi:hypothetical protein
MSNIARHHNEWLSLIEISSPFLKLATIQGEIDQENSAIHARFCDLKAQLLPFLIHL